MLSFFGLRDPLIATIEATLNANLAIGFFNITLGSILAAMITVWASFLVSKFLRFLLEKTSTIICIWPRIPYAISTMLHYLILLLGFFVAVYPQRVIELLPKYCHLSSRCGKRTIATSLST